MTLFFLTSSFLLLGGCANIDAFVVPQAFSKTQINRHLFSTATDNDLDADSPATPPAQKPLGLITFDLDDTLYPISVVVDEANAAFANAMERFGYDGIKPSDIIEAGRKIRLEMPPDEAAALSHTDIRSLSIRRVMEDITFERKLEEIADDFSTAVENLSKIVVEPARR